MFFGSATRVMISVCRTRTAEQNRDNCGSVSTVHTLTPFELLCANAVQILVPAEQQLVAGYGSSGVETAVVAIDDVEYQFLVFNVPARWRTRRIVELPGTSDFRRAMSIRKLDPMCWHVRDKCLSDI